jgi:branched-chain amino acid transport system ATP-binding protein
MAALIETKALSRSFGGLKAVDAVDFWLEAGEIRALIGPNGAGKTTLVGLICGRVAPY